MPRSQFSGPPWDDASDRLDRSAPPATRPDAYPLWGHQPPSGNQGGEGDYYSSLTAESALEHARALYFALTGEEEDGTIASPAGGHDHDTARTCMPWLPLGSFRMSAGGNTPGYRIVSETSDTPIAFGAFIVPAGASRVGGRVHVVVSGGLGTTVTFRLRYFAPSDLVTVAADAGYLSHTADSDADAWLEWTPVDLSGIATTDSRRIVYFRLDAKVNANTADVYEVNFTIPDASIPTTTYVDLSDTAATPDEALTASELKTIYLDNVERLRQLTFGTTYPLPRHSRPHDHGEGRGDTLTDRPLLALSYGPHFLEGSGSGGTIGLPLAEPASGASFVTTPKLIAQHGLFVPGQVSSVVFRVATYEASGGDEYTLKVEVRPFEDGGYGPGDNLGVTGSFSFSPALGSDPFLEETVTLDLSSLGSVAQDRVFELCVWQTSNIPGGYDHRLCCLLAYAGTAPTSLPEIATHQPREELPVSKVLEGQEVGTLLAGKAHRALNQLAYEVLGGTPGLESDLSTVDTDDPWRRLLTEPHQHRGEYTDNNTGERVNDGAVRRAPLLCQHFAANVLGGTPENSTADADPAQGIKIHRTGSIAVGGWWAGQGLAMIPQGLGAFDLRVLVQPGTSDEITRLIAFVAVTPLTTWGNRGSSIVTQIRSGPFSASPTYAGSTVACQVLPVDGAAWQPNADRIANGLGTWTLDALRFDPPDDVSTAHIARWSQPIRVEIAPADTYPCEIIVRLGLQEGAQTAISASSTYDADARVLAVLAVPSAGY